MLNPEQDLTKEQYADLLLKFACCVEVKEDYFDPRRVNFSKGYTILSPSPQTNGSKYVIIAEGSCGDFNSETFDGCIVINVKYLKMMSRRHIPRNMPKIHDEEVAWANNFPTCVCGYD